MASSKPVGEQWSRIALRELDRRAGDGIEVRLLWNTETEDVLVSVFERDGMGFEFQVAATDALDAFKHPYAYAAYGEQYIPLAA